MTDITTLLKLVSDPWNLNGDRYDLLSDQFWRESLCAVIIYSSLVKGEQTS